MKERTTRQIVGRHTSDARVKASFREACNRINLAEISVDGLRPHELPPTETCLTSEELAVEAGVRLDLPRYYSNHNHCQYQRTG